MSGTENGSLSLAGNHILGVSAVHELQDVTSKSYVQVLEKNPDGLVLVIFFQQSVALSWRLLWGYHGGSGNTVNTKVTYCRLSHTQSKVSIDTALFIDRNKTQLVSLSMRHSK
jgi:hypothetical protein